MSLLDGWTPPGSITPFGGVPCTFVQPAQPAQICVCNVGHHPQRLLHVLHLAGEHGHGEQREAGPDVPSTGLVGIRRVRTGLVRVAMMTMRCVSFFPDLRISSYGYLWYCACTYWPR